MANLRKLIRSLDILAPDFSLNVEGERAVKTIFGSFMSLLYFGLVACVVGFQFQGYLDTSKPIVMEQKRLVGQYVPIDLAGGGHLPIVFIKSEFNSAFSFEELKKYVTVTGSQYVKVNGEVVDFSMHNVDVVPCGELMKKGKFNKNFYKNLGSYEKYVETAGICFDFKEKNTTIGGSYADKNAVYFSIYISPCSLDDLNQCADFTSLSNIYVHLIHLMPTMDFSNKKQPIDYIANSDDFLAIQPHNFLLVNRKLMNLEVADDEGFLFERKSVQKFTDTEMVTSTIGWRNISHIACSLDRIGYTDCKPYFEFAFLTSNAEVTYTRFYKGLLETVGEIGGLKDLIMMSCFYIYFFYHKKAEKDYVIRSVFGYKQKDTCLKNQPSQQLENDLTIVNRREAKMAFERCEQNFDVISLAKELECLRFLVSLMLERKERNLLPTVALKAAEKNLDLAQVFCNEAEVGQISSLRSEGMPDGQQSHYKLDINQPPIMGLHLEGLGSNSPPLHHGSETIAMASGVHDGFFGFKRSLKTFFSNLRWDLPPRQLSPQSQMFSPSPPEYSPPPQLFSPSNSLSKVKQAKVQSPKRIKKISTENTKQLKKTPSEFGKV